MYNSLVHQFSLITIFGPCKYSIVAFTRAIILNLWQETHYGGLICVFVLVIFSTMLVKQSLDGVAGGVRSSSCVDCTQSQFRSTLSIMFRPHSLRCCVITSDPYTRRFGGWGRSPRFTYIWKSTYLTLALIEHKPMPIDNGSDPARVHRFQEHRSRDVVKPAVAPH